jgi:AmmeMemoRadiSam system protein A
MAVPCAALMCHAPIVIPELAGARAAACEATTRAMRTLAARLLRQRADLLVIISPHTPRQRLAWGLCAEPQLYGDLGRFGVPEVSLSLPGAPAAARALADRAVRAGLACVDAPGQALDHGAFVPLHFLHAAGWRGPTLLIALPYPGTHSEVRMGELIATTATELGQRWLVLASGDMSHRLQPDAPAGFHPRARDFDAAFKRALEAADLRAACNVDAALRELAAEDVVDSCAVAAGAVGFDATGAEVLAYEGPFGVGYLEAVLHDSAESAARPPADGRNSGAAPPAQLLRIARQAIEAALEGRTETRGAPEPPWREPRGVFVTLRTPERALRGCIGHLEPVCADLGEEIARCAVSAATEDPRFAPVGRDELDGLTLELSLLSPRESVASPAELDPQRYGVVVSRAGQRAVLLPGIEGVDSVDQQLAIARRKAGIPPGLPVELERFEVQKLAEAG